ncbi:hypothetical protein PI125_g18080 [Phytophthora idaei]|nr:hypothetical protein PI125_g18080 [Phytophthora idaei]
MAVNDVFKLLNFKNDGTAFISRTLDTLEEYVLLYNRAKRVEETLVGALAKCFGGDAQLAKMLMRARSASEMNGRATSLQYTQFGQWVDEGVDSTDVFARKFDVAEADASTIEKRVAALFKEFYGTPVSRFTDPRRS